MGDLSLSLFLFPTLPPPLLPPPLLSPVSVLQTQKESSIINHVAHYIVILGCIRSTYVSFNVIYGILFVISALCLLINSPVFLNLGLPNAAIFSALPIIENCEINQTSKSYREEHV